MAFRRNMHMIMNVFEVLVLKSVIKIDLRPVFIALYARCSIELLPSCSISLDILADSTKFPVDATAMNIMPDFLAQGRICAA